MILFPFLLHSLLLAPLSQKKAQYSYNLDHNNIFNRMKQMVQDPRLCKSQVFRLNVNVIKIIARPKGLCNHCCKLDINRDIKFNLYTKTNPANPVVLPISNPGAALRAGLNPKHETIIFIHGFLEDVPGPSGNTMKDAFLSRPESYNVIILDWSELAAAPFYIEASQNTRYVAKVIANFLHTYHDSGEIPISSVHIIGFSLGAQVAGKTGKMLRGDLKIRRITGLDPAYPLFALNDASNRLAKGDAIFVDIIHTDGGLFGFPISLGDADFYPNGGRAFQPGCSIKSLVRRSNLDDLFSCSHQRAWAYYSESVRNPEAFPSSKCEHFKGTNRTCAFSTQEYMGFGVSSNARGNYYLDTRANAPFGKTAAEQLASV